VTAPLASLPAAGSFTDLRLLKGVGDNLAARLAAEGVPDIPSLAALDPQDVVRVDDNLGEFAGRIARDRLDTQARLLDAGRVAEFEARFGRLSG
jgi:predicted flap endonuclease-1-like 5' DNA nuclease